MVIQAVEIAKLTEERDLAIAHDQQPYPTAHAYERVCKTLEQTKARCEKLEVALRMAINSVECASLDANTDEELPWYRAAHAALSKPEGGG